MKRVAREFGFAVLAWAVPFAVSVCIFPVRERDRALFEMVMAFMLTANTTLLGLIYLRRVTESRLRRAILIGLTWIVANWVLDRTTMKGRRRNSSYLTASARPPRAIHRVGKT